MAQIKGAQGTGRESFGFLVQTLARQIDATMKTRLKEHDVGIKIFANLMLLARTDGINQREIGKNLNFPEYYTSRNVDTLVEEGLAERRPDPDSRRSLLVFLTDKGRSKAAELPAVIRDVNASVLAELTEKEQNELMRLLLKVQRKSD